MKSRCIATAITLAFIWSGAARCDLTTIYDSGNTESLTQYYALSLKKANSTVDEAIKPSPPLETLNALVKQQLEEYKKYEKYGKYKKHKNSEAFNDSSTSPDIDAFIQFPVHTRTMSPGPVASRALKLAQMTTPLFLMGSDDVSRQWLVQHRGQLESVGAIGMLVEVDNADQVEAIKNIAGALRIFPASADDIAKFLQLKHYPVLISSFGIEQ